MLRITLVVLLVLPVSALGKSYERFETALLNDNYGEAMNLLGDIAYYDHPDRYVRILNAMEGADHAKKTYASFKEKMSEGGLHWVKMACKSFVANWQALPSPLPPISDKLKDKFEATYAEVNSKCAMAKVEYEKALEEEEQQGKERVAADIVKRKETDKKWNQKLSALDANAKAKGFLGLDKRFGIGRFLYGAQRNGDLVEGLNRVFWTSISTTDSSVDKEFKLSQVVDGYQIYSFTGWIQLGDLFDGNEISLAIAIPDTGLPMQGQRLSAGFYAFKGNLTFKSASGANVIVQKFEPVIFDK